MEDKGSEQITVNGKVYELHGPTFGVDHNIEVGDTVRKDSGSLNIYVIKRYYGNIVNVTIDVSGIQFSIIPNQSMVAQCLNQLFN